MDEFRALPSGPEVDAIANELARNLRSTPDGSFELRRVGDWVAVPSESASHFTRLHIARLTGAFAGHPGAFAIAMEPLRHMARVFSLVPDEAGLTAFNRACSHFNYAIVTEDHSSIVICSTGDFLVTIGSPRFVTDAIGSTIAEAFDAFEAYAMNWKCAVMARVLHSVLVALRDEYPRAANDEWVRFPT